MSTAPIASRERLASSDRPATVPLMGLEFSALSEGDTIEYVLDNVAGGRGGWLCTANLDIVRQFRGSAAVRELVSRASLIVADGMPLVWASGLQGTPLPERVAGSTLVVKLSAAAAAAGASIFLLGGNPGTAEAAASKLAEQNPGLHIAGTVCPPFGFEEQPDELARIERLVLDAAPDIVYVGLGFPKQELLIARLRAQSPNAWFVSCGISFSFVAGEVHRAPALVQRVGLEWLHRLVQEPKRLARRYLVQGIPFLFVLLWSAFASRVGRLAR